MELWDPQKMAKPRSLRVLSPRLPMDWWSRQLWTPGFNFCFLSGSHQPLRLEMANPPHPQHPQADFLSDQAWIGYRLVFNDMTPQFDYFHSPLRLTNSSPLSGWSIHPGPRGLVELRVSVPKIHQPLVGSKHLIIPFGPQSVAVEYPAIYTHLQLKN